MGWETSNRRSRLPADWRARRAAVFARAGNQCEYEENDQRCLAPAEECDHIRPNDDHSLGNLQALCHRHHAMKTAQQRRLGYRARSNKRAEEPHPGIIQPRDGQRPPS